MANADGNGIAFFSDRPRSYRLKRLLSVGIDFHGADIHDGKERCRIAGDSHGDEFSDPALMRKLRPVVSSVPSGDD